MPATRSRSRGGTTLDVQIFNQKIDAVKRAHPDAANVFTIKGNGFGLACGICRAAITQTEEGWAHA